MKASSNIVFGIKRLFFFIAFILPQFLFAKTWNVGEDRIPKTLKEALYLASPHDTLILDEGVYQEGLLIVEKPVTILGNSKAVLDGKLESGLLHVKADSVHLEGLIVKNVSTSYVEDHAGIKVSKSKLFSIRNCQLDNTFFGIFIEESKNGLIENNKVLGAAKDQINSGNGIHLWHCNHISIIDNHVNKHRDGIYFEFVDDSEIKGNVSDDNLRYGLHFMFSNRDNYTGNVFRNNGAGVAVMFSKFINMYHNEFLDNWGQSSYGLLLKEIYDGELIGNKFIRNTIGINAEGSNRIIIQRNHFEYNGWAIKILGACFNNSVNENNFLYNSFDLAYSGKLNENNFDGNYWSEYNGYDLDKDGIGDVPFRPVKLFNYVVYQVPESIIMIRSMFVYLIDFSEKVSPVFTPDDLEDSKPLMQAVL